MTSPMLSSECAQDLFGQSPAYPPPHYLLGQVSFEEGIQPGLR
jgi:hypothetical protein